MVLASVFNVRMFADDTNLTMVSDTYFSLQTKVNCEIQKIDNWLKSNKLSLNYNKTEYMIVTRKKKMQLSYKHRRTWNISKRVYQVFRGDVRWFLNLEATYCTRFPKLSNGCWALSQIRKYSNSQMVKKVYFALLYPHIQYCITNWGCAAKSVLDPLIKPRMVRIMTFSFNKASSMPLFHKLNLLTLNNVFKLEIAKVMHNIENNDTFRTIFQKILNEWIAHTIIAPDTPTNTTMYYRKLERKPGKNQ